MPLSAHLPPPETQTHTRETNKMKASLTKRGISKLFFFLHRKCEDEKKKKKKPPKKRKIAFYYIRIFVFLLRVLNCIINLMICDRFLIGSSSRFYFFFCFLSFLSIEIIMAICISWEYVNSTVLFGRLQITTMRYFCTVWMDRIYRNCGNGWTDPTVFDNRIICIPCGVPSLVRALNRKLIILEKSLEYQVMFAAGVECVLRFVAVFEVESAFYIMRFREITHIYAKIILENVVLISWTW